MIWRRSSPITGRPQSRMSEIWEQIKDGHSVSYEVDIELGKPLDVVQLKGSNLEEIRRESDFLRRTASELYGTEPVTNVLTNCPCCDVDANESNTEFDVFEVSYVRCRNCGHVFVRSQPDGLALNRVYSESKEYAAIYTDAATIDLRLTEIVQPKLDWVIRTYQKHCSGELDMLMDVGAGGGHFVEVCNRSNIQAVGIELSNSACRFAKDMFGIDMVQADFLACEEKLGKFNVITMWGLLEYTPEPRKFLEAARRQLNCGQGIVVVEVPRFDCLGTAVQKVSPEILVRHAVPTSHVNLFSDVSLLTALIESGLRPVAAWYYGMDIYEMLTQFAIRLGDSRVVDDLVEFISPLQASLDLARLSDDIVIAAVPMS